MGGTRIATSAEDAGIFGNPASLVSIRGHNFAFGIGSEDTYWTELPKQGTTQFAAEVNLDISPGFYYSQTFRGWGVSGGYTTELTNFANFRLERTNAEYDRRARQFSSTTDLFTDYDLRQEGHWVIGFGRTLGSTAAGARLRWVRQAVYRGTTLTTLNLAARHGPEVDITAPEALIAAIIDEIQFGDRVRDIVHDRQPSLESVVNRLELDIGFQHKIWLDPNRERPPLLLGALCENLLRADLVEPLPFRVGIGAAYRPLEWVSIASDLWRAFGQKGVNFAFGGELRKTWTSDAPKSVAFRAGIERRYTDLYLSWGIGGRLGTTYLEYTMGFRGFINELNRHLLAFTLRF